MSRILRTLAGAGLAALASHAALAMDTRTAPAASRTSGESNLAAAPSASLPPLPTGVAELKFSEFFKRPVGPYGLEPSAKLRALDGARVRIMGYMVEEEASTPGLFILSPIPVSLSDVEDGPADDLPGSVVFVHLQGSDARVSVQHQAAPLLLVGTLEVGNQVEANDRVSGIRLLLESPLSSDVATQASTDARPYATEIATPD